MPRAKRKRVNPNKVPVTKAAVARDMRRASDSFLMMCLYGLLESGADVEMIRRFAEKFGYIASAILENKLPVWLMQKTIEEDYEKELAALEADGVRAFFMGEGEE